MTTTRPDALTIEQVRAMPKVALHDHLDGGLRPQTVIDHCKAVGHSLPTSDPMALGRWFFNAADSGNLGSYLSTFNYTIAAMQEREHLQRVAHEFVLDQADDGVVYAEARWAPEQHTQAGLTEEQAVLAVRDGFASGVAEAAASGREIRVAQILTSMRHAAPTTRIAELVVKHRDDGVCGFDIAGAEEGFPPARFKDAFDYLRRNNALITIHAGEACGPESIHEALQVCGAHRIGHGVRLIEDIVDGRLGRLAAYVRDLRVPLEVCPTSNLQTGIASVLEQHPVDILKDLDFKVTISCDNRLMSGTTLSREFARLSEAFGWDFDDIEWCTVNAADSAFMDHDDRERLIADVIGPAFAAVNS